MTTRQRQIADAQRFSRVIEAACESEDLYEWFEGTHIGTLPEKKTGSEWEPVQKAKVIFGDCPWTELVFDANEDKAYVYIGRYGKARVPQRAISELHSFFNTLHNC